MSDYSGHMPDVESPWPALPGHPGQITHDDSAPDAPAIPGAVATDDKGRPFVHDMTDRAVLAEILTTLRAVSDGIEKFSAAAQTNPMLRTLLGG